MREFKYILEYKKKNIGYAWTITQARRSSCYTLMDKKGKKDYINVYSIKGNTAEKIAQVVKCNGMFYYIDRKGIRTLSADTGRLGKNMGTDPKKIGWK